MYIASSNSNAQLDLEWHVWKLDPLFLIYKSM